jgi:Bacterial Ig-like domain (group 2)
MPKLRSPLIIVAVGVGLACASATGPRPTPATIRILQANPFVIDSADTERLTADVFDSTGVLINAQVRIAWQSAETSVVQVDQTGLLTPRKFGFTTVRATVDASGSRAQDSIVVDVTRGMVTNRAPADERP